MALDPVFLEIFGNKVVATCEEMSLTLQRTSRTLFVKEAADFACALVGLDGRAVAYPRDTGCLGFCDFDAKPTIDAVPNLEPGDVIITNDPYTSGALSTHLPDIHLIEPHFHEGRIVSYGWTFVHSTDVGGGTPGSLKPSFDEIYQEGLRIPPMKLLERGVMDPKVEAMLRSNCRIPDLNMGDVRAMLAGQRVGRLRVAEIIARHGVETYLAGQKEVLDYSEAKARAVLRRIPDGEAEFWDYMDDDYVSPIPVRLRVKMTVRDGLVHFDVTGTDPELKSAFNVCAFDRMHEWTTLRFMTFISTYDPTVIPNHGMFRPLSMTNPRGTVLNCEFPAALGSRDRPARRLHDALNGALLKVAPDMMCAPSGGAGCVFFLAEYLTPDADERSVSVIEYIRGGMGAMKGLDGVDNRDASIANLSNNPIEVVERECGVLVREWNIQQDSGGPGQWRGGVGQRVTIEFLRDNGMLYGMGMDRMRFNAFGACGGKPGSAFRIVYNLGRPNEREYGKVGEIPVNAGDTITAILPGGAGYGDPFLRDPEAVLRDVERGFVSREAALRDYGVVLDGDRIDLKATETKRRTRVKGNTRADFDFGPEREAWESVFDDATMNEINRLLFRLPRSSRYERRRWLFAQAVPNLPKSGEGISLRDVLAEPDTVRARLRAAMATLERGVRERAAAQ